MFRRASLLLVSTLLFSLETIADPVILFSDLSAGPKTGWSTDSPEKGAVITLWGRGFGTNRRANFVSVGSVPLNNDNNYLDTWGKTNNPVPFLESITFQLDSTIPDGNVKISVSVNNVVSNEIDFFVNDGRIFFVDVNATATGSGSILDPWNNPVEFLRLTQLMAGDILYFRSGIYDQIYVSGKSVIWIESNRAAGTKEKPIALVGFPGETAVIDNLTSGSSNFKSGIKIDTTGYTVSKLHFKSISVGVDGGNDVRIIGNDIVGLQTIIDGSGMIVLKGNAGKALGNATHGARSNDRLDHAIYIQGCAPVTGNEVAWNHIYDNSFDRGPNIVVNHQVNRCPSNVYLKSHYIHHNLVDCSLFPSRGIGLFDQSWDVGESNEPEPTYVYNNIVYKCGITGYPSVYQASAHGIWFNNAILNARDNAVTLAGPNFISSQFVNNIITLSDASKDYINPITSSTYSNRNLYFGAGVYTGVDINPINSDPLIIENNIWNMTLDSVSPARDVGENFESALNLYDFHIEPRIADGKIDVGPVEYVVRPPSPPSSLLIE